MLESIEEPIGQFRVNYGSGLTPTEQFLRQLGERSFLRFWSHANPHQSTTHELCDLLVVCGDFVILFSDKSSDFQFQNDTAPAWRRWYKRAVAKSVNQLGGAERHLLALRSPIYKDSHCTVPLGIVVPSSERARVYRVAVVSLTKAIVEDVPPLPFIQLDSAVVGGQHIAEGALPFHIGDVAPESDFVHVIDLAGLWAVLSDLDTITDFTNYLDSRRAFIQSGPGNAATNEWCALAKYQLSFNDDGDRLALDDSNPGQTHLENDLWRSESAKEAFRTRKEANRISYTWDSLVDQQIEMYENQTYAFASTKSAEEAERVARQFALETRLNRRTLSKAWREACHIEQIDQAATIRTVPHSSQDGTTYVFFTLKQPDEITHDEYRQRRRDMLQNLVLESLVDVPTSTVVVGIASELGQPPDSYDIANLYVEEESNLPALMVDAKQCWDFKKGIFGDPHLRRLDEWDFPNHD